MSQLQNDAFELDPSVDEEDVVKEISVKDNRTKQRQEARRRIDELLEQKRLKQLLDDWDLEDDE